MTVATIVSAILQQMPEIKGYQKKFLAPIILLFMGIRGKINFKQMSRYGAYNETSYHTHFEASFDHASFNKKLVSAHGSGHYILAFDPTYLPKSGKHTPDIGQFWSGCAGSMKRGIEIGVFSLIDVDLHTGFHLASAQTPNSANLKKEGQTLLGYYANLCKEMGEKVQDMTIYLVVDAYFSKKVFIDIVTQDNTIGVISRLRQDAKLRYLYNGPKNDVGRPKLYDGYVDLKKIDNKHFKLVHEDKELRIWDAVVNYSAFERNIRLAYVEFLDEAGKVKSYQLFFSTDLNLPAFMITKYYKLRFQIEFEIRDAKQFTGLADCQSRNPDKLNFHVNTALTTISVAKAAFWCEARKKQPDLPFSMADIKTLIFNQLFMDRLFSLSGIDAQAIKSHPDFHKILTFGVFNLHNAA
jgi:hypothetical protein